MEQNYSNTINENTKNVVSLDTNPGIITLNVADGDIPTVEKNRSEIVATENVDGMNILQDAHTSSTTDVLSMNVPLTNNATTLNNDKDDDNDTKNEIVSYETCEQGDCTLEERDPRTPATSSGLRTPTSSVGFSDEEELDSWNSDASCIDEVCPPSKDARKPGYIAKTPKKCSFSKTYSSTSDDDSKTDSFNSDVWMDGDDDENVEDDEEIQWMANTPNALSPIKKSKQAAGYDLRSAYDMVVPAHDKATVPTEIRIKLPKNCYGRIAGRSGLASKRGITIGAGVIDADYRGPISVILFNHSDQDFEINRGDRIAQLICERIYYPKLRQVKKMTRTERGENGLGSSGVA